MGVFIPNNHAGSRSDTAVLLVGTAREFKIDQHDIKTAPSGFFISDALAQILEDEDAVSGNETIKTSGNRAAKNSKSQKGK